MLARTRVSLIFAIFTLLVACGDGRGSLYSSARAISGHHQNYDSTAQRSSVQTTTGTSANYARVLTQPVAITPGAKPVYPVAAQATARVPVTRSRFATGPIYAACRQAGRKQATHARCGCVQWSANQRLSSADQRRGARYFQDQHALQEIKMSDSTKDEIFWRKWRAFGSAAGQMCRGT